MINHSRSIVVAHPDAQLLANSAAHRLIYAAADAQAERGEATVVLTGGTIGTKTLAAVAASPAQAIVDWSAVNFWWGDERFTSAASPDRNAFQAAAACLSHLPLDGSRVHPIPGSDIFSTVSEAGRDYAKQLSAAGKAEREKYGWSAKPSDLFSQLPIFDVLLLGVGPDSHIASLFPQKPGVGVTDALTISLTDSPKPPPARVSLTLPAINTAREVWFLVSGSDKAEAVAHATGSAADPFSCPASGASGTRKTVWLVDRDAASQAGKKYV